MSNNSSFDVTSMFDSIKESLKNDKKGNILFKDILKLEPTNTYVVRLIPNIENPKKTFFHYFHHGWTSLSTGQYVDSICPTTWEERCPVCEERFRLYRTKKEEDKKLAGFLRRLEKHYVNIFVVEDPVTPENNNMIKILRFGVRLNEKIQAAIDGDDAKEFGPRVFDLTENGCNFKIKVETNKENNKQFTNYSNSRFTSPCAIANLTPDKIKEIYEKTFKLEEYVEVRDEDSLKKMVEVHLYGKIDENEKKASNQKQDKTDNLNLEEPAPKQPVKETPTTPAPTPTPAPATVQESALTKEVPVEKPKTEAKSKIDSLLADLDKI